MYDTLDDFRPEALKSIQTLHLELLEPLKGCVGVAIGGHGELTDQSEGHWGRGFELDTGEHVHVRVCPRNMVGKKLGPTDTLMIGVRRTGTLVAPQVCFAIVFNPDLGSFGSRMDTDLSSSHTIGCRGLHIMLPSLFNIHDPHRYKTKNNANVDLGGFHSIRPSTLTVAKSFGGGPVFALPGYSHMVMAGHMGGVNMPDPIVRPAMSVTFNEHQSQIAARSHKMVRELGCHKSTCMVSSALTIAEIISAEGVLGIMCNSFFEGLAPDMMHSPIGTPLMIVMAIHIACFPYRYKLPTPTENDRYACRELRAIFESRWTDVMDSNGYRAIDCVMSAAYENSVVRMAQDKKLCDNIESYFEDTMILWQRVGQRVATKLVSNIYEDDQKDAYANPNLNTRLGRADLLDDPISAAKYAYLNKCGLARPVKEAPINRLFLASKSDLRTTLIRVHDSAETWLRTGMYGDLRLSAKNVNAPLPPSVCKRTGSKECDCIESQSDVSSEDEDTLLDHKLNKKAMETAAGAISSAMIHGPFVMHQFGIETYLVGDGCSNQCADCDKPVGVLQGTLLNSRAGECMMCNRRRCYECSAAAILRMNPEEHCKRCESGCDQTRNTPSGKSE